MRTRSALSVAGLLLLLIGGAIPASAQFAIDITVDENGNGHFHNTAGFNSSLPFAMQPDSGPGGLASALTYDLLNPPALTAGDLVMLEPGTLAISDIIRFNPNQTGAGGGAGVLVFYSDNSDGADALADTGFPAALYANNLTVFEVGPEGNNGFDYTPTAGQPGFVAGAGGPVTYHILSDTPAAVPEPGALALVGGLALPGILLFRRRSA